MAEGPARRRVR